MLGRGLNSTYLYHFVDVKSEWFLAEVCSQSLARFLHADGRIILLVCFQVLESSTYRGKRNSRYSLELAYQYNDHSS
jgi:hypothetical protein